MVLLSFSWACAEKTEEQLMEGDAASLWARESSHSSLCCHSFPAVRNGNSNESLPTKMLKVVPQSSCEPPS